MFLKKMMVSLAAMMMVCAAPMMAQAKTHRVVFALTSTDEAAWMMTLGNIHNLMKGFGDEPVEIELVAYGPGIVFLKNDATVAKEVKALESEHVHFMACQNSMNGHHLTVADMSPGVIVVPAGIVEVVKKEEAGWSYIKAGD